MLNHVLAKVLAGNVLHVRQTALAATLNQPNNLTLGGGATSPLLRRTSNAPTGELGRRFALAVVHLVSLNDLTLATHRSGVLVGHGFADAVRHEPSGVVGHLHGAVMTRNLSHPACFVN